MTPLSDTQKQLLFDYSLGLTSGHDAAEAEDLLAASHEAARLYDLFLSALSPLETVEPVPCPDELAERTIQRLKERAQLVSGGDRLERLLADERQAVPARIPLWRNWAEIATVAAVLVLLAGVLFPALGVVRQRQWQYHCQSHLGDISAGVASYLSDHDGRFPTLAMAPGAPWWMIGRPGPENQSNTRRVWLLVKQRYLQPDIFICPARPGKIAADLDPAVVVRFDDFPSRAYIHFSLRLERPQSAPPGQMRRIVLLADRNPLAEEFPSDFSALPSIPLRQELLTANSRNHKQRGQSVLFSDGSVEFTRSRHTSFSDDDIFTVQGMSCASKLCGCERPASENDTFVAP
jgi:hypothetical protein